MICHKSAFPMNLFPSDLLFKILSIKLFDELYFLSALLLYAKVVAPDEAFVDLSANFPLDSASTFWLFFYFKTSSLIYSIIFASSPKLLPSSVFNFGSQIETLALNTL